MLLGTRIIRPIFILILVKPCFSVKGCTVILRSQQSSLKKAVCNMPEQILKSIPTDLPEALVELEISFQDLQTIYNKEFIHLPKLEYLSIVSSNVQTIQEGAFIQLSNLKSLSLFNNSLIISTGNSMSMSKYIFFPLLSLTKVDLSYNSIGNIPDFFFNHVNQTLESLHLSHSKTEIILSGNSLMYMTNLKSIHLEYSQMTSISRDVEESFNIMSKLKEIILIGNLWNCDCQLRWFLLWIIKNNNFRNQIKINRKGFSCTNPPEIRNYDIFGRDLNKILSMKFQCIPEPITSNSTVSIYAGQNISLTSIFRNVDEKQNIFWENKGNIFSMKINYKRFIITEISGKYRKSILTILNVSKLEEGIWKCFVDFENKQIGIEYFLTVESENNAENSPVLNNPTSKNAIVYASVSSSLILLFIIGLIIAIYYCKFYKGNLFSIIARPSFNIVSKRQSKNHFYKNIAQKSQNPFSISKDSIKLEDKIYDNVPISSGFYINFTKKKNEQNFSTLNCLDCQNYAIVDEIFTDSSDPHSNKTKSPRFWYLDDAVDGIEYLPPAASVDIGNNLTASEISDGDSAFITRIPSRTPCPIHSSHASMNNLKRSLSNIKQNSFNQINEIEPCPIHGKQNSQNSYSVHFRIPDQQLNSSKNIPNSRKPKIKTKPNRFCNSSDKSHSKNYFPVYLSTLDMQVNDDTLYRQYSCLTNSVV